VGVGAASGAVAGGVGWVVAATFPAAGGLAAAVGIGVLSGALAAGWGQITANAFNPCVELNYNLDKAVISGAATGGIAGGTAYGAKSLLNRAGRATLQRVTTSANQQLGQNPSSARGVLTQAEYAAGQRYPRVARMQYGNAMERLVAKDIRSRWLLDKLFTHVGGPNNPDFVGKGLFRGLTFDITTNTDRAISSHLTRPYGQDLILALYDRPPVFRLFP
jgi:hypothetical protein